jgi:putative ABC transport system permease protein
VRVLDMLSLPVAALWQQKSRTLLTTLGVVFGSFVLAASLSIGEGVQDTIERESRKSDMLRKITVYPEWHASPEELYKEEVRIEGKMSDAKRERLRKALVEYKARFRLNRPRVGLTPERLQAIAALSNVEAVVPVMWQSGFALLNDKAEAADIAAARPDDIACRNRIVAGRFFENSSERAAVLSEFLLYRMGITDDAEVERIVGKTLRLEIRMAPREGGIGIYLIKPNGGVSTRDETTALDKIKQQLPDLLDKLSLTAEEMAALRTAIEVKPSEATTIIAEEFKIAGVVRMITAEEVERQPWDPLRVDGDLILPFQTAADLYFRQTGHAQQGVHQAVVVVDHERNTIDVFQQIKDMGLSGHAALEHVEQQRMMYLLIFGGMTCVAAVALLVAALGIANTMLMSVLERTREIGIMKAVGAAGGQLQFIFLLEGALIGLVGGGLGMLLAWAASFPGDAWVRSMVSRDLKIDLKQSIFVFPPWVIITVLLFAVVVTTLAAVYPARRAAKVDPVAALRHE